MLHRFLASPLLLVALGSMACGSVAEELPEQQPDPRGDGLELEGSYELTFTTVEATMDHAGPPAPEGAPPSRGHRARLDLRRATTGGYEAVFTSRWGVSAAYAVTVSDAALTLSGEGRVGAPSSSGFGGTSDTWHTLTLARTKGGLLSGAVEGSGREDIFAGDVAWGGKLSGSGTLSRDVTAPELKTSPLSRIGPADQLLPWDTVVVTAAEPLARADVIASTKVTAASGEALSLTWLPSESDTWAGGTTFSARVDDWASAMKPMAWQLSQSAGVRDRVGNAASGTGAPLKFLRLGIASGAVDFDTDSLDASFWGTADVLGGGLAGTDDPRCESGGCLRLGPAALNACSPPRAGMAVRLNRGAGNRVALRYRVLAQPMYGDMAPFVYGSLLTMELAAPGAPVQSLDVGGSTAPKFTKLAAPIDGMTWATEWTTFTADAPAGTGPVGVAVAFGGRGYGCGGPPPPATNLVFLIEQVAAE